MTTYSLILLFTLLGGVLSVLAAALFLILPEKIRTAMLPHMVSFAIGVLLCAAFLSLLPHALTSPGVTNAHHITFTVLVGILVFFMLEKLVLWRHCHTLSCEVHTPEEAHGHHNHHPVESRPAGTLVLIGDAIHNSVDGVLIAAAFLTDTHLGIVTALAVAAHEIPQEVGDFAILLHSGYSRKKALFYNVATSFTGIIGATLAYFTLSNADHIVPYVLAIAAASFIYVAVADLIPGLHSRTDFRSSVQQVVLITSGVLVMYVAHSTLH